MILARSRRCAPPSRMGLLAMYGISLRRLSLSRSGDILRTNGNAQVSTHLRLLEPNLFRPLLGWRSLSSSKEFVGDPYQLLGVDRDASIREMKKAFRILAHKYHPDKRGGDEATFRKVRAAFEMVSKGKSELSIGEKLCQNIIQELDYGHVNEALRMFQELVKAESPIEYYHLVPTFLAVMARHASPESVACELIDQMNDAGMLPDHLYQEAFNDLLGSATEKPDSIDFAMTILQEMDKRKLVPDIATARAVFSYYGGLAS